MRHQLMYLNECIDTISEHFTHDFKISLFAQGNSGEVDCSATGSIRSRHLEPDRQNAAHRFAEQVINLCNKVTLNLFNKVLSQATILSV